MAHTDPSKTELSQTDPSQAAGFEISDVRPRSVLLLATGLAIVVGTAIMILNWLFTNLEFEAARSDAPVTPLAKDAAPATTPGLELGLSYREYDRPARQQLQTYGWIEKQQGIVRIPIERAMQLLAERGLPEPAGQTVPSPEPPPKQEPGQP